jgi:hypothetical protein
MRAGKVDDNQRSVVMALRAIGCLVHHTHEAGGGFPDLLVGYRGRWLPVEIKDGSKPPSARKLTPRQVIWHDKASIHGLPVLVVTSGADAIEKVRAECKAKNEK